MITFDLDILFQLPSLEIDDEGTGIGRMIFADGTVWTGPFEEDVNLDGHARVTTACGVTYEGEWKSEWLILEGDCKNGFGKKVNVFGNVCEGIFKNRHLDGPGKITFSNGDALEGVWKSDDLILVEPPFYGEGYGEKISIDGRNFEQGTYKNGMLIEGTLCRSNYYEDGEFEDYRLVKGCKILPNGTAFEGEFDKNGKLMIDRPYKIYHSIDVNSVEDVYTGEKNLLGQPHGVGTMRYADESIYAGDWKDGVWHGNGKFTYGDCVYEGAWKNGYLVLKG